MRIKKAINRLSWAFSICLIISALSSTALAADSAEFTQVDIQNELSVDDAIQLVSEKVDENTLKKIEDAESAYMLNGQIHFQGTTSVSGGTNSDCDEYIPMADNINLYNTRAVSGYSLKSSYDNTFDNSDSAINGYGVVNCYVMDNDKTKYFLEMNSNARGSSYYYALTKLSWEVTKDNSNTKLTSWSPQGTTTSTSSGFPISVSVSVAPNVNVGTSFDLFQKQTTLAAGATSSKYSASISGMYLRNPYYQNLNAIAYYTLGSGTTNFNWNWNWGWDLTVDQ